MNKNAIRLGKSTAMRCIYELQFEIVRKFNQIRAQVLRTTTRMTTTNVYMVTNTTLVIITVYSYFYSYIDYHRLYRLIPYSYNNINISNNRNHIKLYTDMVRWHNIIYIYI